MQEGEKERELIGRKRKEKERKWKEKERKRKEKERKRNDLGCWSALIPTAGWESVTEASGPKMYYV